MASPFPKESERVGSKRRRRWGLWIAAAIILPLGAGTCWLSRMTVKQDFAISYAVALCRALLSYADDHGGRLPNSFDDLVNEGYVQPDSQRGWIVSTKATRLPDSRNVDSLRHPEWFDVAWGVSLNEIDQRGWIARLGRHVLQPASDGREFAGLGAAYSSTLMGMETNPARSPPKM